MRAAALRAGGARRKGASGGSGFACAEVAPRRWARTTGPRPIADFEASVLGAGVDSFLRSIGRAAHGRARATARAVTHEARAASANSWRVGEGGAPPHEDDGGGCGRDGAPRCGCAVWQSGVRAPACLMAGRRGSYGGVRVIRRRPRRPRRPRRASSFAADQRLSVPRARLRGTGRRAEKECAEAGCRGRRRGRARTPVLVTAVAGAESERRRPRAFLVAGRVATDDLPTVAHAPERPSAHAARHARNAPSPPNPPTPPSGRPTTPTVAGGGDNKTRRSARHHHRQRARGHGTRPHASNPQPSLLRRASASALPPRLLHGGAGKPTRKRRRARPGGTSPLGGAVGPLPQINPAAIGAATCGASCSGPANASCRLHAHTC